MSSNFILHANVSESDYVSKVSKMTFWCRHLGIQVWHILNQMKLCQQETIDHPSCCIAVDHQNHPIKKLINKLCYHLYLQIHNLLFWINNTTESIRQHVLSLWMHRLQCAYITFIFTNSSYQSTTSPPFSL